MKRVRNFLLCLVLLALAGILHHEWLLMSGSSGIATPASAADLNSGQVGAFACNGTGAWHFVNNQTGTTTPGTLTATFNCGGNTVVEGPVAPFKITPNGNQQFIVNTSGACTLEGASTNLPGNLVLSDVTCAAATPTPTPTPTP